MHPVAFARSADLVPALPKRFFSGETESPHLALRHPSRLRVPTTDRIGTVSGGTDMTFVMTREALEKLLPEYDEFDEIRMEDPRVSLSRDGHGFVAREASDPRPMDIAGQVVHGGDFYANCIRAIFEAFADLPVVTVLQGVVFDARDHDTVWLRRKDDRDDLVSGEEFLRHHPYGILLRPENRRVWPRFVSAATGKRLHGITSVPEISRTHQNAFLEDPVFEGVNPGWDVDRLAQLMRARLVPLLRERLDSESAPVRAHA